MYMVTNMTTARAAVIIPHYNDVERLDRCLAALMLNDTSDVEIVVVDNGSTQSLDALRSKFETVQFLEAPEKGAAVARNTGVEQTDCPYLYFIDADCVADEGWIARAHQVADTAGLIGGRVDVFDETPPPRSGAEAFETVFAFNFRHYIEVQGFTGAGNLITSRRVFEDVGGFRNGLSEDKDWSMRAVAKGHKLIYDDALIVSHPSRRDWPALRHKWLRVTQELFATHGGGAKGRLSWGLRGLAMPLSILAHAPKILRSDRLSGASEKSRALMTLIRLRMCRMVWMLGQAAGMTV